MNTALVVAAKEIRESLRDRKILINAFLLGPLLGPLIFLVLINFLVSRELERAEKPLPVVVIGAEHAPNLIAALRQDGLEVRPAIPDPEAAVREQRADLVLRIAPAFAADWQAGKVAEVEMIFDSSRNDGASQIARLRNMLNRYSRSNGALRLLARGISPTLTAPLLVAERDQATPQSRGALLFMMLPYMLIFTAFMGGMSLAIDATAGERERQSLEPLLINPVPRARILAGKVLATAGFSLTAIVISLAAFMLTALFMPTGRLEMSVNLGWSFCLAVLPVMVPLVMLLSLLQTLVAAFSKSFREAQTALGLLQLLPMLTSVALVIAPLKSATWMYAVPLLGQQLTIMRSLRAEPVTAEQLLICIVTTCAACWLAWLLTLRTYSSERLAISG